MLKVSSHYTSIVIKMLLVTTLCFSSISFAQQSETATPPKPIEHSVATTSEAGSEQKALQPTPNSTINDDTVASDVTSTHDLTPWGMYKNADIIVKIVMIGLLLASLATWTIFIAKLTELTLAKKRLRKEMASLNGAKTLKQACSISDQFAKNSLTNILINDIQEELDLSANTTSQEGIKERAAFRQDRLVAASGRQMNTGTSVLATIGSVSPFIGLFGTVWGIMNSFIGIAETQTTNLAVVAPGIAEALLATAMGLVAAIPAVIIYNIFVRAINSYRVLVSDISAKALLLLSRDLDRENYTSSTSSHTAESK